MLLKHKNMRDVAAKVVEWPKGFTPNEPCQAKVWWVNLNTLVGSGKPFICSSRPETIWIKDMKEWEELEDVEFT